MSAKPKRRPAAKAKAKRKARAPAKRKPAAKVKTKAKAKRAATPKAKAKPTQPKRAAGAFARWPSFVAEHGVVLASARGPVPSVAEAVAGEPIVGSWWSHPKAHAIFDALSAIDDSDDIRCFRLVDEKITFVHRRLWPALARLANAGVLDPSRVAALQQEHMPTGEHRNLTTVFPDWVPDDVARTAQGLSVEDARAQLGSWI